MAEPSAGQKWDEDEPDPFDRGLFADEELREHESLEAAQQVEFRVKRRKYSCDGRPYESDIDEKIDTVQTIALKRFFRHCLQPIGGITSRSVSMTRVGRVALVMKYINTHSSTYKIDSQLMYDRFFQDLLADYDKNLDNPKFKGLKPTTIWAYVNDVHRYLKFLDVTSEYENPTEFDKQQCGVLKRAVSRKFAAQRAHKYDQYIEAPVFECDVHQIYAGEAAQEFERFMDDISVRGTADGLNRTLLWQARDMLMSRLVVYNWSRPQAIGSMTLATMERFVRQGTTGFLQCKVWKHKTGSKYPAYINISDRTLDLLKIYVDHIRPLMVDDDTRELFERPLFVSYRGRAMDGHCIGACLSDHWLTILDKKMNCTLLRKYSVSLCNEKGTDQQRKTHADLLAHSVGTAQHSYVQQSRGITIAEAVLSSFRRMHLAVA